MERLKFTIDATIKLDGQDVTIKSGTLFVMGEGMTVSEDTEVVVNGDLYLLERGDRISFSEAVKKPKPEPKKDEDEKLPSEDEWEEDEEEYEEENYEEDE